MKITNPKTILISRTDSIGDVVLTLPMIGILRKEFPLSKIIFLGNTYTSPIINCVENLDVVIEWAKYKDLEEKDQIAWLESLKVDVFIHVLARKKMAILAKKAKIPYRIGTSHRLFHFLTCNKKVGFSRKNSDLHESQLNIKLLKPLGITKIYKLNELQSFANFKNIPKLKTEFQNLLKKDKKNLIFHCKSQGSALEWGIEKFISLAISLDQNKYDIFFTGTENEAKHFRNKLPKQKNIIDLSGQMSLYDLIAFISKADLLLAGSTGPLHISGISNVNTIGLFTTKRPLHPERWKPLGKNVHIITEKTVSKRDGLLDISVQDVTKKIACIFMDPHQ